MNTKAWTWVGGGVAVMGVGAALLYSRRAAAAPASSTPPSTPTPPSPTGLDLPLPRASDVRGDLTVNWGITPEDFRPLFMLLEEVSRIEGAGRLLSVFAYRESRYITTAQNGDAPDEQAERDATRKAYLTSKDRNPPLRYGERAADFGSGGLFGLAAPYFLWTGVPELGKKAPLLNAPPELLFQPRASAFGAAVYLQRLIAHYRVDDHADLRAGWASPTLLTTGRGSQRYLETRARFLADAKTVGIDLDDASTIPPKLSASQWPGVAAVFAGLVGSLPSDIA